MEECSSQSNELTLRLTHQSLNLVNAGQFMRDSPLNCLKMIPFRANKIQPWATVNLSRKCPPPGSLTENCSLGG